MPLILNTSKLNRGLFNHQYVLSRNRFPWIDYARGICIILVCYRHSFEGLINANFPTDNYPVLTVMNSALVTFRMALFFFMSGVFIASSLSKKGYGDYVVDRLKVIIYPLLVWGAIQITLQLLSNNYTNAKRSVADYVYLLIMPRKVDQFWYLNTLFFTGILYAYLKAVLKLNMFKLMLTALLLYSLGALYFKTHANMRYLTFTYTVVPDVLHYFIFVFLGDAASGLILDKKNEKYFSSARLFVPAAIVFLAAHYAYTIINNYYNKGYYVEFYMPATFLLVALSGCLITIQICFILQRYESLKFLRVLGYHSLYIYLMHVMITSFTRVFFSKILHITYIPLMLSVSVFLGVVIPVIAYNIFLNNGMWWMFSLKKPAEEKKVFTTLNYNINQRPLETNTR